MFCINSIIEYLLNSNRQKDLECNVRSSWESSRVLFVQPQHVFETQAVQHGLEDFWHLRIGKRKQISSVHVVSWLSIDFSILAIEWYYLILLVYEEWKSSYSTMKATPVMMVIIISCMKVFFSIDTDLEHGCITSRHISKSLIKSKQSQKQYDKCDLTSFTWFTY